MDNRSLPPISRTTDPDTSKQSAAEIIESGERTNQVFEAVKLVRQHPGHTCNELARLGSMTERQLSRRLSDASRASYIRPLRQRRCSITNKPARPWVVT